MSDFTEVRVWLGESDSKFKARGSFLYHALRINFTIFDSIDGLFVSLPGNRGKDKEGNDKWYSNVYCQDDLIKQEMNDLIMKEYNRQSLNVRTEESSPTLTSQPLVEANVIPF